ncbi:MAG TPA: TetR/AcrR family transcriptional regulator [Spirochaetota bacterium]|nr:TetR/AcrR family transcriptional regulator [Spirochaetota bacterium]HPC39918.1 TetR/AcrR family transcriptional regulator [Spirochaetota bacterium]HPL18033.1 TetR/AcrR family transcriptional regulator [Spirochaetota bacterium]HQF08906.1 TetR/AcrR family transcriptional regulator [Spirochaetota bacterium]HQH97832.1 TetR/AcrR family transcriptional regulator [Spirochaetota bacterium]
MTQRKKKTTKTKEDVKLEIIKKSREVISKMGWRKSSTEEIAKTLNKTKSSLYHYFDNREELIRAVVHYEGEQIKEALIEAIGKEKNPQDKLMVYFATRIKKIYKLWDFYKGVIEEYFLRYSFIMMALDDYMRYEQQLIENILTEGNKSGLFSIQNIPLTSRALIKMMMGFDFFMFQGGKFKDIQDELAEGLRQFIRGMLKK